MGTPVRLGVAVLVLAALTALAACGSGDGDAGAPVDEEDPAVQQQTAVPVTLAELDGRTFVSTGVEGHELVPGSTVTLAVEGERLSVSAGCNTLFGAAVVEQGSLRWAGDPASTLVGCPEDLQAQDQWLAELLGSGVQAGLAGESLVLSAGEVTLTLGAQTADQSGSALEELLGSRWVVTGTVAGDTVERLPSDVRAPYLDVAADGGAELFTGCNKGRTTVSVEGDALVFGAPAVTRMACGEPAATVERRVLSVLDGVVEGVSRDGEQLVLVRGGTGFVAEVR